MPLVATKEMKMSAIDPREVERAAPGEKVRTRRYFIQWRRVGNKQCRTPTAMVATDRWRDLLCSAHSRSGATDVVCARAIMRGLRAGRDPGQELEWRILRRTFEITAEVVE